MKNTPELSSADKALLEQRLRCLKSKLADLVSSKKTKQIRAEIKETQTAIHRIKFWLYKRKTLKHN